MADAAARAAAPIAQAQAAGARVIGVDGRSGAGKSVLAVAIARQVGAQLVSMEQLYPGWAGLAVGSRELVDRVLGPWSAGRHARWRTWNWERGVPGDWVEVTPGGRLVIEGCGALTRASRSLIGWAVWLEVPENVRRARVIRRDGPGAEAHWAQWAAQEEQLIAAERPDLLANLIVSNAALP